MIQVQLNLPKLTNKGKSNRRYINQLEVEACKKLGGITTSDGRGKWLNDSNGKLYFDNINIFQIAIDNDLLYKAIRILSLNQLNKKLSKKELFIKLCKKYGKLTKQLTIYVVVNNKPRLIEL